MLNDQQKSLAIYWYSHKGYSLQTVAQHFGLTQEQISRELRSN
jgi:DNA-binding transcriptional regulator LsrR (DeoR family)